MKKTSKRAARIVLHVIELLLIVAIIATPGSSIFFLAIALVIEISAIALEVIGLKGAATLLRAAKKYVAAHGRARAKKWAWSAIGLWWLIKSHHRPKE